MSIKSNQNINDLNYLLNGISCSIKVNTQMASPSSQKFLIEIKYTLTTMKCDQNEFHIKFNRRRDRFTEKKFIDDEKKNNNILQIN